MTLSEKWVKVPLSDFELKIEGRISERAKNRGQQRIRVLLLLLFITAHFIKDCPLLKQETSSIPSQKPFAEKQKIVDTPSKQIEDSQCW